MRLTAENQVAGIRHYQHGGAIIAARTITGLTWFVADHHNTSELALDPASLTVARRRTLPFGGSRGAQPDEWPIEKSFVGGTQDPTGLVHLGAREYDPAIGRFLSVDMLIDEADPQQWNAYAYASNSPATLSDPSGLIPSDCLEFDCRGYDPRPLKKGDGRGAGGCPGGCGTKKNIDWGNKHKKSTTKPKKSTRPTSATKKAPNAVKAGPTINAEDEPSGGGVPVRQAAWCADMGGYNCALANALSNQAIERADDLKDLKGWENGERNAFRHAYWMALMTANGFTVEDALYLGEAHERDGDKSGQMWGSEDSNADLHNNAVGARIGAKVRSKWNYVAPVGASGTAEQKIEVRLLAMLDGYDPSTGPYTRTTRDGNLRMVPPKK